MKNQTPKFQPDCCLDCRNIKGVNCSITDVIPVYKSESTLSGIHAEIIYVCDKKEANR
jgi:hypothetical protein